MIRLNLVLLLAVLASAVYLVSVQYESRRIFTQLDQARAEARRLETEYDRLQVEKRAQATPARVEKLAREKLQMRQATPAITHYVTYSGAVVPAQPAFPQASGAARTGSGKAPVASGVVQP